MQRLGGTRAAMRAQVVEYDDGSGFDDGSQLGLDIGVERGWSGPLGPDVWSGMN
jgi:hypothetical protein